MAIKETTCKGTCRALLTAAALASLCPAQETQKSTEEELADLRRRVEHLEGGDSRVGLVAYWDSGLRIRSASADGFKLRIGGRIHNDWAVYDADRSLEESVGEFEPGTEFRRADLYVEGTIYEGTIDYKFELEFSGGIEFQDTYVALRDLPVGTLRFGMTKKSSAWTSSPATSTPCSWRGLCPIP